MAARGRKNPAAAGLKSPILRPRKLDLQGLADDNSGQPGLWPGARAAYAAKSWRIRGLAGGRITAEASRASLSEDALQRLYLGATEASG